MTILFVTRNGCAQHISMSPQAQRRTWTEFSVFCQTQVKKENETDTGEAKQLS